MARQNKLAAVATVVTSKVADKAAGKEDRHFVTALGCGLGHFVTALGCGLGRLSTTLVHGLDLGFLDVHDLGRFLSRGLFACHCVFCIHRRTTPL